MKNLFVFALVTVFSFSLGTSLNAQDMAYKGDNVEISNNTDEVKILENFKATKAQKKVIKKITRYVTPKILTQSERSDVLAAKSVRVQLNFDAAGAISHITVVDGVAPQLDERVVNLIKEYDSKTPLANSNLEQASAIQFDVALANTQYYIN